MRGQGVVQPMVTKLAATVLAALGLTTGPPQHASHGTPAKRPQAVAGPRSQPFPAVFVTGHGWGHGVGLAQYGAYGYALHDWSYDQIVDHYYPGTTLDQAQRHSVRVLLVPNARSVVVSSRSDFAVRDGAGRRHELTAGSYTIRPDLKMRLPGAKRARPLPGPLFFLPGAQPLSLGNRGYRGALRLKSTRGRLQVVNVVGLERYLWGVVPSEMPQRWPAEALAAQAVVARTYALAHLHRGDFDLYSDTRSQVYGGIAAEAPSATAAVNETAGKVVVYDGGLADTFFFSSSGGRTANVQDVWSGSNPVPYLVSVPDPYDTLSPYHSWGPLRFGSSLLVKRLHVPGQVVDFHANVASSGRVRTITFVGRNGERTVTGSAVRSALGLRSTWFRLGLLSLVGPRSPVVYGSPARLTGTARGVRTVTLELRPYGGSFRAAGRLRVVNGAVNSSVRPRLTTDYRLLSGGFRSGVVRVAVAPLVQLSPGQDGVSVSGSVRPLLPGAAVEVQRLESGAWRTVATTAVDSTGSFATPVDLRSGSYRARVTAGRGFAVGLSETVVVTR
jgi:stage II sporulation protein D